MLVGNLIARSLRVLRVLDPDEAPEARDFETAVVALNAIGARWAHNGLLSEWTTVTAPGAVLPDSPLADDAYTYQLAVRLRTEYGVQIEPDVISLANESLMALWRDRLAPTSIAITVGTVVLRALRVLRTAGANPDAFNLYGALIALNAMVRRWEANGIALGWQDVTSVGAPLPAPPEAEEAIAFNLAIRLRSEYGAEMAPDVITIATSGLETLRRDVYAASPLYLATDMPRRGIRWNIYTDSPGWPVG